MTGQGAQENQTQYAQEPTKEYTGLLQPEYPRLGGEGDRRVAMRDECSRLRLSDARTVQGAQRMPRRQRQRRRRLPLLLKLESELKIFIAYRRSSRHKPLPTNPAQLMSDGTNDRLSLFLSPHAQVYATTGAGGRRDYHTQSINVCCGKWCADPAPPISTALSSPTHRGLSAPTEGSSPTAPQDRWTCCTHRGSRYRRQPPHTHIVYQEYRHRAQYHTSFFAAPPSPIVPQPPGGVVNQSPSRSTFLI